MREADIKCHPVVAIYIKESVNATLTLLPGYNSTDEILCTWTKCTSYLICTPHHYCSVLFFFCCVPVYRALQARYTHWDDPENDPRWNVSNAD